MPAISSYRFGQFELDLRSYELKRDGEPLRLEKIPMELLIFLVEHHGVLVTREQIIERLWGRQTFLDTEQGINTAIRKIRQVLLDEPEKPEFLETVVGKGYRFVGNVVANGKESPQLQQDLPPPAGSQTTHNRTRRLWLLGIASAFLLSGAVLLAVWHRIGQAAKPRITTSFHSIAVLPLENLSGDLSQEYFADGITDALITQLAKVRGLRVISRTSVMQYKDSRKPLAQIARELNVDAVVEGSVSRAGSRVRVTAQLIDAHADHHLWAESYERDLSDVRSLQGEFVRDVLGVQDEIARTVTAEVQVKLTPQERARLASARVVDPEAQDEYLRGRYLLGMAVAHLSRFTNKRQYTASDIVEAIGHFKHAIAIRPAYAMAYAGLADAYITLGNPVWGGHSPKETLFDAKEAATKAIELDPSLPEAHFSLAQTLEYEWNWSEAEKEFKRALELNPNYADAHLEYGRFLQAIGRNDEAMTEMNNATEVDPFGIKTRVGVAWVTWASHQYDRALQEFESLGDDFGLILTYREKEMYPEALAAWERWKLDHPAQIRSPHPLAVLAGIYGLQGRKHEGEALIDEMKEAARHQYVSGFFLAEAYVGLSQKDKAITWLERAYEEHDQWMVYIASYPGLDPLRSEPHFQALLRRMNFPR
jgi:TolB-like protein/tetratricopeptide (TPR) repeat protein/DNA-binding winged helix-turn-helix (wHTH) protein